MLLKISPNKGGGGVAAQGVVLPAEESSASSHRASNDVRRTLDNPEPCGSGRDALLRVRDAKPYTDAEHRVPTESRLKAQAIC